MWVRVSMRVLPFLLVPKNLCSPLRVCSSVCVCVCVSAAELQFCVCVCVCKGYGVYGSGALWTCSQLHPEVGHLFFFN